MKKTKKMICIIVALIALFVFSSVAFAAGVNPESWASTVCLNGFTCKAELTKPSGDWYEFLIDTDHAYWPGHSTWTNYVYATFKSSSGALITPSKLEAYDDDDWLDITAILNPDPNTAYLRIDNPHPGYNMYSGGDFRGWYE